MTAALAILLIIAVAAFIVFPLFRGSNEQAGDMAVSGTELWDREKATAVLAIAEADFDLATGKLSNEDYRVLRTDYEGRALHAMDEIDKTVPLETATSPNRFCGNCGTGFLAGDAFCGRCGSVRSPV